MTIFKCSFGTSYKSGFTVITFHTDELKREVGEMRQVGESKPTPVHDHTLNFRSNNYG
jgi:hypothetical protein